MEVEGFIAGGGDRTDELKSFVGGAVLPAELNVSFPVELTVCTVSSLGDVQAGCPVVVLGSTPRRKGKIPCQGAIYLQDTRITFPAGWVGGARLR